MASSGTLGTLSGSYKTTYTVTWSLLSQDTAANTSKISLTATFYTGNSTTIWSDYSTFTLDGTTVYSGAYSFSGSGTKFTRTKDITVTHNSDGSFPGRSVSFSTNDYVMGNKSGSGTISGVPAIPRKATVSDATNMNDETNPTVYFSNPGNMSLVPYINLYLNGSVALRLERSKGSYSSPYTWNITEEERQQIRLVCKNVSSTTYTIGFDSYSGSTSTGYSSVERTLTIINATPVFENFEWETTNYQDLTGDKQTIIKGFSSIKTIISDTNKALAKKEASIKSYQTVAGTKTKTNSTLTYPVETTVNNVDGVTVSVFVNDSRGLSTKIEKSVSKFIDLLPLGITEMDVNRNPNNDEEVMLNVEGIIDATNFGLLTNTIDRSRYYYKIKGTNDYIEGNTNLQFTYEQIKDNQYKFFVSQTIEGDIEEGFSSNGEYDIKVTISDKLTEVTKEKSLEQGRPAMAILGNCIALGAPYNEQLGGRVQIPVDVIYPVGSIYLSVNNTDPGNIFGGTWEKLSGGYLYAAASSLEKTSYSGWGTQGHSLSTDQLPSHTHYTVGRTSDGNINPVVVANSGGSTGGATFPSTYGWTNVGSGGYANCGMTGAGQSHSHNIATVDIFVWKRTA